MRNCAAEFCILKLRENLEVLNRGDFVQTVLLQKKTRMVSLEIVPTFFLKGKLYLL